MRKEIKFYVFTSSGFPLERSFDYSGKKLRKIYLGGHQVSPLLAKSFMDRNPEFRLAAIEYTDRTWKRIRTNREREAAIEQIQNNRL